MELICFTHRTTATIRVNNCSENSCIFVHSFISQIKSSIEKPSDLLNYLLYTTLVFSDSLQV